MSQGTVTVTVYGIPVGQGNIRYNRAGRGYHANAADLQPWRDAVCAAACRATGRHMFAATPGRTKQCALCKTPRTSHGLYLGPVGLAVTVTVPKPDSAPRPRAWPVTRSSHDWDHHARAISDALTGVLFADDSQIVEGRIRKTYPDEHPEALGRPGAVIRIWPEGEAQCQP
ncbi:RusA family crossover junction endodeoxyribonuclease [Streptomyces caeni]|uniref:RusA family crossover junction endodeoxyribonuclease n=1 Tax=Streptomyces caeni TaxID=2307231 RepID=A0ABW4IK76_9ACTN